MEELKKDRHWCDLAETQGKIYDVLKSTDHTHVESDEEYELIEIETCQTTTYLTKWHNQELLKVLELLDQANYDGVVGDKIQEIKSTIKEGNDKKM